MDSNQNSREKGAIAENMALEYLQKKGYVLKKANFHFGKVGEIDLIFEFNNALVFVEVKSKHHPNEYDPISLINFKKQKVIKKVAEAYLYVNKIENKECRFDVMILDFTFTPVKIDHLENAFW